MDSTWKKIALDPEYLEKLDEIIAFTKAQNRAQAVRNIIDFFFEKNAGKMSYVPETIEKRFSDIYSEIELLKNRVEDLEIEKNIV